MIKIFITGGAGYIGSNFVRFLKENFSQINQEEIELLVYDNFSTGSRDNLISQNVVEGDLNDRTLLKQTLQEFQPDIVFHFAASISVGESVQNPLQYYQNNTLLSIELILLCEELQIKHFVFSSTATVYQEGSTPMDETTLRVPLNPYGDSKKCVEDFLFSIRFRLNLNFVILRYFNVIGTDPQLRMGKRDPHPSHLLDQIVLSHLLPDQFSLKVLGNDYPTADGTGIRDYVEMDDLCLAHGQLIPAMIENRINKTVFNIGYNQGLSVLELISMVEKTLNISLPYTVAPRRQGDPPYLVANTTKIQETLGWNGNIQNIEKAILSTYHFFENQYSIPNSTDQSSLDNLDIHDDETPNFNVEE